MLEDDLSRHEEVAKSEARDEKGHFIHIADPEPVEGQSPFGSPESSTKEPQRDVPPGTSQNPSKVLSGVEGFLSSHTHYAKNQDDLLDVHVGNPLRRISQLLEDIKRQKAFSFTLKGSLGLAGVALALGVFGIFGGGQILCDKGIQSEIGTIHMLNTVDSDP